MTSVKWVFTINNYTEDTIAKLETAASHCRYLVYGKEVAPSTGTPHLQGYLYLHKKARMNNVKNILQCESAHLEISRGSPHEASAYCKKDGVYKEFGLCPIDSKVQLKNKWDEAYEAAKEGRFDDIPRDLYVRYMQNWKRIFTDNQPIPQPISHLDYHWFYGDSGTGKSVTARLENPDHYIKGINKWWDGYREQKCVIIEEWTPMEPSLERIMGAYLKTWCDHHPFYAETKGGSKMIRPPKIIVTSNWKLEDCFREQNNLEPLQRRLKIHKFSKPFNFNKE